MQLSTLTLFTVPLSVMCNVFTKIKRCCPPEQHFDLQSSICIENSSNLTTFPLFPIEAALNRTSLMSFSLDEQASIFQNVTAVSYGFPKCLPNTTLQHYYYVNGENSTFRILFGDNEENSGIIFSYPTSEAPYSELIEGYPWLLPLENACFVSSDNGTGFPVYYVYYCSTERAPRVNKCCPWRHVLDKSTYSFRCVRGNVSDWVPNWNINSSFYVEENSKPLCGTSRELLLRDNKRRDHCRGFEEDSEPTYLSSGAIRKNNIVYHANEYCGDYVKNDNQNFLTCRESGDSTYYIFEACIVLIGGISLFLTVLISVCLPELHRSLQSLLCLTHNATLMVAYITWGVVKLYKPLSPDGCIYLGLLAQFSFMASQLWMNFLWACFYSKVSSPRLSRKAAWKRYIYYSGYVWGIAGIITIFTAIMEFMKDPPLRLMRPGLGCYCDFSRKTYSILIYIYSPIASILLLNLFFYIECVRNKEFVAKILKQDEDVAFKSPMVLSDKEWFTLYKKLFIFMGLTWIMEIILWALNGYDIIFTVIHFLRAIFIFILFICKKFVFKAIRFRFQEYYTEIMGMNSEARGPNVRVIEKRYMDASRH